jgi:hypothetical protein
VRNGQLLIVYVLTVVQNEQSVELKALTTIERIMDCVGDDAEKYICRAENCNKTRLKGGFCSQHGGKY